MAKTARKPRSDSVSEVTRVIMGASKDIRPPAHVPLDEVDEPFWDSVVKEFARADWSDHQLEIAAMLARTMADLNREQRLLREEGGVIVKEIKDSQGAVRKIVSCVNSRARSVSDFMSHVMAMRRSLALNARAKTGGSNQNGANRRAANKKTEQAAANEDDNLLS